MSEMEDTIIVEKVNEAWIKVFSDRSILHEMFDYFSFYVKDYKYMPKFKSGLWDGKLRLLNLKTNQVYSGLFPEVLKFAKGRQYEVVVDDELKKDYEPHNLNIDRFIEKLKIPFVPYDYQVEAFNQILKIKKILILSPTSSGKTMIAYLAISYAIAKGMKVLFVVPTTTLCTQLVEDFYGYSNGVYRPSLNIQTIHGGASKTSKNVIITLENDKMILVDINDKVILSNNKFKYAKDLIITDEICDNWLSTRNQLKCI